MANQYKNKIIYGDQTLMDITDTTATSNDVLEGQVFYSASGARSVGTLGEATQSTHGLMSSTDKIKLDGIATGATADTTMTGATSSTNGTSGLVPAPTSADIDKFLAGDGTYKSGGLPMVILSYGNSTWNDFITAYNNHVIVYCRASSNANPASGQQLRMAFMAYVAGNAETPTEVEFQYYRSVSSHSATQMGDQVFVYKLTNKNVWSVITREASIKQIKVDSNDSGTVSWSNNVVTLKSGLPKVSSSDNGKMLTVTNGAWATSSSSIDTFIVESKNLTTISGNYLEDSVEKSGYTPIGIVAIDGTNIDASNTIRLFYISGTTARVYLHEAPTSGSYLTVNILYKKS